MLVMYSFPTEQPVTAQNMSKRIIEHLPSLYILEVDEANMCLFWGLGRLQLCSTGRHGPFDDGELGFLCKKSLSWTKHDPCDRKLTTRTYSEDSKKISWTHDA